MIKIHNSPYAMETLFDVKSLDINGHFTMDTTFRKKYNLIIEEEKSENAYSDQHND